MAVTKSVEDLEIAINQFLETNNQGVFKPFIGKCSKLEPYGEPELGKAINSGDMDIISKLIYKLSDLEGEMHYFDDNNSQTESNSNEQTDANLEKQLEELDQVDKDKENLKNSEQEKQLYKALKENADKNKPGVMGDKLGKGSKLAAKDSLKYEQKIKEASNTNRAKQDDAYLDSKKEILNTFKPKELSDEGLKDKLKAWKADHKIFSELRGNKMEISKKDIEKLMSAMKTVQNFAAEKIEDQVEETESPAVEDEEKDAENVVVEMPEDVAETIREALNTALDEEPEEDDEDGESESEEEDFSEDDMEDEDAEVDDTESEEDFCGDSENFSVRSFYEFSKAITETIENLNKKADKLAGREISGAEEFIENFSAQEFRSFAESVTEALENINTRVAMLDSKVANKEEVTTNIDTLNKIANDYEDNFITKSDEDMTKETDPIVQNPECGVVENAQFSQRYENVKNFLSL